MKWRSEGQKLTKIYMPEITTINKEDILLSTSGEVTLRENKIRNGGVIEI